MTINISTNGIYRCVDPECSCDCDHESYTTGTCTCQHSAVIIYDKITDKIICTESSEGPPHEAIEALDRGEDIGQTESVSWEITQDMVLDGLNSTTPAEHERHPVNLVTDNDPDNLGFIYLCEKVTCEDLGNYYISNSNLAKKWILDMTTDAVDTDGDGTKDMEGDGITTANLTVTIRNQDTNEVVTDAVGIVEFRTERGKILDGRQKSIVNGVANAVLRSVPETVQKLTVKADLVNADSTLDPRGRAAETLTFTFK